VQARIQEGFGARQEEMIAAQAKADDAKNKIRLIEEVIKTQADNLVALNAEKAKSALEIGKHMQTFKNVHMREPKDPGHELFKWFLGVIYNESQAKYDFENFKNEVLKKDKGNDFVERLRGFRAFDIGKDEVAHTNKLLAMEKEVADHINPKKKPAIDIAIASCFTYVKIIDKINHTMEDMRKRESELESASKKVDLTAAEFDKFLSRQIDAELNNQISVRTIQTFEFAKRIFETSAQKCRERKQYISETLPNLKNSLVKPKKTEVVVEVGGQEEEIAFGTTAQHEKMPQTHQQVRATYESDINEIPPQQKEGCKCIIF